MIRLVARTVLLRRSDLSADAAVWTSPTKFGPRNLDCLVTMQGSAGNKFWSETVPFAVAIGTLTEQAPGDDEHGNNEKQVRAPSKWATIHCRRIGVDVCQSTSKGASPDPESAERQHRYRI